MTEKKSKILLIDDSGVDVTIIEEVLSQSGFEVSVAENGKQGIIRAKADAPDISAIILDRRMPVMDGNETLQKICADESTSHIPVLMLTGDDDVSCIMESLSLGAQDYLVKPFVPNDLVIRVKMLISGSDVRRKEKLGLTA